MDSSRVSPTYPYTPYARACARACRVIWVAPAGDRAYALLAGCWRVLSAGHWQYMRPAQLFCYHFVGSHQLTIPKVQLRNCSYGWRKGGAMEVFFIGPRRFNSPL